MWASAWQLTPWHVIMAAAASAHIEKIDIEWLNKRQQKAGGNHVW